SFSTEMICSSLKRLRRMALLLIEGPNLSVAEMQGSTSWFMSLDDALAKMEVRRREYNEVRLHSAIGNEPPITLINGLSGTPAGTSHNPGIVQLRLAQMREAPQKNLGLYPNLNEDQGRR
ncbi:integrase core domain-containing protein, partial [Ancylobacter sonchi]|nr:integrase core domain-containing protein [Ancylobacter sonchi]